MDVQEEDKKKTSLFNTAKNIIDDQEFEKFIKTQFNYRNRLEWKLQTKEDKETFPQKTLYVNSIIRYFLCFFEKWGLS